MKSLRAVFQTGLSIILVLTTLLQSAPVLPARSQALTTPDAASPALLRQWAGMLESVPTAPLAIVGQQQVEAQAARVEPPPVLVGTPLPPGTVMTSSNLLSFEPAVSMEPTLISDTPGIISAGFAHAIYIPLVLRDYVHPLDDLALHPDIWMQATQDWLIEELPKVRENDPAIIVRRSPTWRIATQTTGLRLSTTSHPILVTVEYAESLQSLASVTPHPDAALYQQKGYQVVKALFKGLPAWQISPVGFDGDFCRKVIVALPHTWVHFQLDNAYSREQDCSDTHVFELVLSSLQVLVGDVTVDNQQALDTSNAPGNQIQWMWYNRQAAYNYAAQYWSSCNNSDGYCAPAGEGLHFIAHVLCAGGFPIHWCANPQQGHSDSRITSASTQRNYVKSFSDVSSTSAANLRIGDVVYIGKGTCWGWGGVVTGMSGGVPYITTHAAYHWNKRYDIFYSICGQPASYDFVHIDASDDYPLLYVNSGLMLDPAVQSQNANVRAMLNVHNYGGQGVTINLRVVTPVGDFAETGYFYLPAGSGYFYDRSRSFTSSGGFSACAQMNTGSGWQYIPATGGGATCNSFHIRYPADPRINSGLNLHPNPQVANGTVAASFYVHNYGEEGMNVRFRVTTNGAGEFGETGYVYINPGNGYTYNQSRAFGTSGTYNTCAQMDTGWGWQNIPQTGGGVTCQYLNLIPHGTTDVRLNSHLQVTPEQLEPGGIVRATFTAQNTSSLGLTENFRARVFGSTDYPESGMRTIAPGEIYTYDASRIFNTPGLYQVTAEHYASGAWVALWGADTWIGSRFVRVMAPPPPLPMQNKGQSPTCGHAGEPVNTSSGNYF